MKKFTLTYCPQHPGELMLPNDDGTYGPDCPICKKEKERLGIGKERSAFENV